jgi:YjbE family integral membrane protein
MLLTSAESWAALGAIVWVNLVLSGDNAVVIALAARSLPARRQRQAIVWGSAAAVLMRVALTLGALTILQWPWLRFIGALMLLAVGVSLMLDDGGHAGRGARRPADGSLLAAVRTILAADLVMSLDNVLAVAAAAKGSVVLLVAGLALSIPLIVFGSGLLLRLMRRWPVIVTAGAALLGWLAGEMLLTDPALVARFGTPAPAAVELASAVGAGLVLALGAALKRHRRLAARRRE